LFLDRMHELLVGNDLLAQDWDAENLAGYRDVLQSLVDRAKNESGEMNVSCRINAHEVGDNLHTHLQLRKLDIRLEREGYAALAKTFARLADGESAEYVATLREAVVEACERLGLPIPPAVAGLHDGPVVEPS